MKYDRYRQPVARRKLFWPAVLLVAVLAGAATYYYSSRPSTDWSNAFPLVNKIHKESTGGRIVELTHTATLTPEAVNAEARLVYPDSAATPAKNTVEEYALVYTSQDARDDREIRVKGRLYLPTATTNAPIFAFGPGTTGPGPDCAASLERVRGKNWGRYDNHLAYYAGQGYAVATTDYDGRIDGSIHHYFVGEMEGRTMLDLVRALKAAKDSDRLEANVASNDVFMAGYSQGGHAALWADQIRSRYAPDVTIKGIIGFAPATDLVKTFHDVVTGGSTSIWLPPYWFEGFRDYYRAKFDPANMLKDPYASTLASDARNYCIDQLEVHTGRYGTAANVSNVYQPDFIRAFKDGTNAQIFPVWTELMNANRAGDHPTATPFLGISGDKDLVILPTAQTQLMKRMCGKPVVTSAQYMLLPNVTHYTAMAAGRSKALDWMHQIEDGTIPATDCGKYRS